MDTSFKKGATIKNSGGFQVLFQCNNYFNIKSW